MSFEEDKRVSLIHITLSLRITDFAASVPEQHRLLHMQCKPLLYHQITLKTKKHLQSASEEEEDFEYEKYLRTGPQGQNAVRNLCHV